MEIRVPQLAEGVEAGMVASVLVKEGDKVSSGQTVVEIESNKAVAGIPAPEAGTVSKVFVREGDEVSVGGLLVTLGGDSPAPAKKKADPGETAHQTPSPEPVAAAPAAPPAAPVMPSSVSDFHYESKSGFPPPASPTIRRMAEELGIDLNRVRGSQPGGRIVIEDVRAYIVRLQQLALSPAPPSAGQAPSSKPAPVSIDFSKFGPVEKKKMSQLRRTISKAMVNSWTTIPHVTQFDEQDITDVLALQKKHAAAYEKKGTRLTLTSFVIKALSLALKKHPVFNSSLDEAAQEIVTKHYIHLGIAVDTDQGLIVPVIRDIDKKSLFEISVELQTLAEKTRQRKVSAEDLQGGSFTLSNQGGIGGTHFTPIINKPESAILGLGRGSVKPLVIKGKTVPRSIMPVALTYDHRIIDGGSAARFMVDLAAAIQGFSDKDVKLSGGSVSRSAKAGGGKSAGMKAKAGDSRKRGKK